MLPTCYGETGVMVFGHRIMPQYVVCPSVHLYSVCPSRAHLQVSKRTSWQAGIIFQLPLPRKIFDFQSWNGAFWCISQAFWCTYFVLLCCPCQGRGLGREIFWLFNLEMAHFDAHLRYSDVGLLILKFCCMCNKAKYMYVWIQDKGQRPKAPRGWSLGRGCAPSSLPGKFLMI